MVHYLGGRVGLIVQWSNSEVDKIFFEKVRE